MRWTDLVCSGRLQPAGGLKPAATLGLAFLLLVVPIHPQTARDADLERIRGEISRLRRKLDDVRAQTKSAERELEQGGIEQEQQAVAAQVVDVTQRVARQKEFLRRRLAALYRLGGLSYLRLLMSIDERRNPIEAMSMLSYLVERDSRAVARFQSTRAQLEARTADLAEKERRVAEIRRIVEQRR